MIFNNYNWRIYVGSSKSFWKRWNDGHHKSLLRNKHSNRFLQADYNKCKEELGHDDFLEFHVIQDMPGSSREERLAIEENWIKVHFDNGKQCYNLSDKAVSREDTKNKAPLNRKTSPRLGVKATEEFKIRNREIQKTYWSIPENRERLLTIVRNKTEFQKNKLAKAMTELWANRSLEDKEQYLKNSLLKTKGNRLGSTHSLKTKEEMSLMRKGKPACNAKNWDVMLLDPNGLQHGPILNLTQFCKTHNLTRYHFRALLTKKISIYKGWTLVT